MASATILLRRSVINGGNQVYSRYLSAAAKQSHIKILPTSVSSIRQFASPASPKYDDAFVNDLLSKVQKQEGVIETLHRQRELLLQSKEQEVGSVKQKHPLLKEIESEIFRNKFSGKKVSYFFLATLVTFQMAKKSINGFKVVQDFSWWSKFCMEGSFADDKISIKVSKPICKRMELLIKVGPSGILGEKVVFSCTMTAKGCCEIDKIKYGILGKCVAFKQLPENVQSEIHAYLELRGINSYTTDSLYEYMLDRLCKEHLKGLHKKFQNLV
ncbi:hypothetical protein POM88_003327 [Heracleum sosnowskyi]|uniref:Uncharacterized protein n=1 Tax=Heracleum sosnowskyi TaxID=360622 RepID=A0AAD8JJM4_9APIA|nr:hypothetical protein POM88_003327 [Heracleum sosnowskyi]